MTDSQALPPVRGDDSLTRAEVVADLRRLAREWGRDMDNEIAGGALMHAAAYFEGTL